MPTLRSMCQGGICRRTTFSLIERAHGRASLYVISDIGAIEPGRWQFWHAFCKIGAMSLLKVTLDSAAHALTDVQSDPAISTATNRLAVMQDLLPDSDLLYSRVFSLAGGQSYFCESDGVHLPPSQRLFSSQTCSRMVQVGWSFI